jgi:hypothetical protein
MSQNLYEKKLIVQVFYVYLSVSGCSSSQPFTCYTLNNLERLCLLFSGKNYRNTNGLNGERTVITMDDRKLSCSLDKERSEMLNTNIS